MPSVVFHSNYWQTQAAPPPADPELLQQYPAWQAVVSGAFVFLFLILQG